MHPLLLRDPMEFFGEQPPRRVISLVPSWTGSLADLGLSDSVVGITDFCAKGKEEKARLGGPQNPRMDELFALKPDLVIANQEENGRAAVEAISSAGIPVWLTFPTTVSDSLADLWKSCTLFRDESAMGRVRILEKNIEWLELSTADQPRARFFCPVWQDQLETGERWWMTFNQHTYSSDVLRLFGGENCFSGRQRSYPLLADLGRAQAEPPGERDTRYPRVSLKEVIEAQPDIILLPDEPFPYTESHFEEINNIFSGTPAVQNGRIFCMEGNLIHWPGTILASALDVLPDLFA